MSAIYDFFFSSTRSLILRVLANQETIMGLIEDISAKLDAGAASLAEMTTTLGNIAADEAALKQQIADLIAAGGGATQAQLQGLLDKASTNADATAAAVTQASEIDLSTP